MTEPYRPQDIAVVLLAAGHGTRMLPLTERVPKPLLKAGGRCLIEHHLYRLGNLGFKNIVINTAYLGNKIRSTLGDGAQYGVSISYSDESETGALETAGGLKQALPLVHSDPFLVINADIWTTFNFRQVLAPLEHDARLVLVPNPQHNPTGDFVLGDSGIVSNKSKSNDGVAVTFSGIALYRRSVFERLQSGKQALAPILRDMAQHGQVEGLYFTGDWVDVGTPERLAQLDRRLSE